MERSTPKKATKIKADELLSFKLERPKQEIIQTPKRRPFIPFKKDRFIQATYRLVILSNDFNDDLLNTDTKIDWNLIQQVYFESTNYSCPICLEVCVAA